MNRQRETYVALAKVLGFAVVAIVTTLAVVSTIRPFGGGGRQYSALFASASQLKPGQQVRVAGGISGQIDSVDLTSQGLAQVSFSVDPNLALTTGTLAQIKYLDLVGGRYLSLQAGPGTTLPVGGTLPVSQTEPALDLSTLFNGFKPLFAALSPADMNALSTDIVQTLQGEGPTVVDLLRRTASLTQGLANHDQIIGQVISNLDAVLGGLDQRQGELTSMVSPPDCSK